MSSRHSSAVLLKIARKRPLICATILAKDQASFLVYAKEAVSEGCDIAELRVDHLRKKGKNEISEIVSKSPLPIIATVRSENDGGLFVSKDEERRLKLVGEIIESSPAFIDIELEIPRSFRTKLMEKSKKSKVAVVLSHHDFHSTPSAAELSRLAKKEFNSNPQIAKLVFQPKNNSEVSRLLVKSSRLFSSGRLYTIFGMGALGSITRVASLLLGGCLIYCSVGKTTGKLGQIDAKSVSNYLRNVQTMGWNKIRADRFKILKALEEGTLGEKYPKLDPATYLQS